MFVVGSEEKGRAYRARLFRFWYRRFYDFRILEFGLEDEFQT